MDKHLTRLLKLIHREALRGYWSGHQDCGSDWSESCSPCRHYEPCRDAVEIETLLKELS